MTRRERLRACAAWTREWPDLPALAFGSFAAGYTGPAMTAIDRGLALGWIGAALDCPEAQAAVDAGLLAAIKAEVEATV